MASQMNFMVTHIYWEENQVADLMANHGLSLSSIVFLFDLPLFVRDCFDRNKQGFPSFRLCTS
jgi:hypothetical protein